MSRKSKELSSDKKEVIVKVLKMMDWRFLRLKGCWECKILPVN